jgi:beta-alanine degradation protein BauB
MTSSRPQAKATVLIDNDQAITTEWRFAPGAETGWHRHGHDYIVVPMTTGDLLLEEPGGTSRKAPLVTGKPYFRGEGVEHNVVNPNTHEFVFIEVEIKRRG